MNDQNAASGWSAARADKWLAQLTGMESMLRAVDEPLVSALRLVAPMRIAEVGSGGGGTALELLRRAPAGSVVHGFDISARLVERARERVQPGEQIVFDVADMAKAAPKAPYDRLVSRFGIMFFDDPQAGFTNLARWLVPGGRFAFAAWGRLADNSWITSVRDVVARVTEVPPPEPDAPGPFRYADPDRLTALLEHAGLVDLAVNEWRGALPIGDALPPAEAARFALASFSSYGELLAQAGDEARDEARRLLTEIYAGHQDSGTVRMAAGVHVFTGSRRRA